MLKFTGMSVEEADQFRAGALDSYGLAPEKAISDGTAPCRCCLRRIPKGQDMIALAYRPFSTLQPYAEAGPIFLCAESCAPTHRDELPGIIDSPTFLLKGYSADERIVYGSGQITPNEQIESYAEQLLAREDVVFVDIRSASNNCWLARLV